MFSFCLCCIFVREYHACSFFFFFLFCFVFSVFVLFCFVLFFVFFWVIIIFLPRVIWISSLEIIFVFKILFFYISLMLRIMVEGARTGDLSPPGLFLSSCRELFEYHRLKYFVFQNPVLLYKPDAEDHGWGCTWPLPSRVIIIFSSRF